MNQFSIYFCILEILYRAKPSSTLDLVVEAPAGTLIGSTAANLDGIPILQFLGIPFAEPPVGPLRFKSTTLKAPWVGVLNATKLGNSCAVPNGQEIIGSEDCLYLNIFTRSLPSFHGSLKPVMVYIYGGGFFRGTSSDYGPEYMMLEDIVLVTFNYRTGSLGFLSLADTSLGVPGNAGLKDQRLALQWVQKNIASFNGDPNQVTLFGESAGSASVHCHILSPSSAGLFHKAIMQSGTILASTLIGSKNALEFAEKAGKQVQNESEALDFLTSLSVEELLLAQLSLPPSGWPAIRSPWGVNVENPNQGAFLTEAPINLLKSGRYNKVPIIIGYVSKEGRLLNLLEFWGMPHVEFDWNALISWQRGIKKDSLIAKLFGSNLRTFYHLLPAENKEEASVDAYSDSMLIDSIIYSVKYHLQSNIKPVFMYRINMNSSLNCVKRDLGMFDKPGTFHADDVCYIFTVSNSPKITPGSPEYTYVKRIVKLWTNFAKYGDPTPNNELNVKWNPKKQLFPMTVLDMGKSLTVRIAPEQERMILWSVIDETLPYIEI